MFDSLRLPWVFARLRRLYSTPPPAVPLGANDTRILSHKDFSTDSIQVPLAYWAQSTINDDFLVVRRDYTFFVSKLEWFKNRDGLQHEYVVATVFHSKDDRNPIYLRFEHRLTAIDLDDQMQKAIISDQDYKDLNKRQRKAIEAAVITELSNMAYGNPVYVRHGHVYSIIRVYTPSKLLGGLPLYETGQLLATYNFPKNHQLRNLAVMIEAILAKEKAHSPAIRQTYWFARTMMRTAQALCPKTDEGVETFVPTLAFDRAGKFALKGFTKLSYVDDPTEMEEVKDAGLVAIQKKDVMIAEPHEAGEGARLKAEEAQQTAKQT